MNSKTNKQAASQQTNTQPENKASDKPILSAKVGVVAQISH